MTNWTKKSRLTGGKQQDKGEQFYGEELFIDSSKYILQSTKNGSDSVAYHRINKCALINCLDVIISELYL